MQNRTANSEPSRPYKGLVAPLTETDVILSNFRRPGKTVLLPFVLPHG